MGRVATDTASCQLGGGDPEGMFMDQTTPAAASSALPLEALLGRYRAERERRLPGEAAREYRDMAQDFFHLLADPYSPRVERPAVNDSVDVLIVGGGFGGLLAGARLREMGADRIRIVEAGGDVGGTWYWNRYPGAACDVESYIYFPLLEETGYMPTERYAKSPEIRRHCQRIADKFGLYHDALFGTQVTALEWDADSAVWRVATDRGDQIAARFVILATGPLNRPKLAAVPGLESFQGHSFHTSRWDYAYTGGSATERMTGLVGKRVGIVGTGATAVQCVPPLAAAAGHLYVFQRTPSSVDARNNSATDPNWAASLPPGWQRTRMENFTAQMAGHLQDDDLVADGWTVLARAVRKMAAEGAGGDSFESLLGRADMEKMVEIRARMDRIVQDPQTAEALKPWFSLFCKRPCFHDDYLVAFNQPNVTLVDTQGRGVERITEGGVVVLGAEYPLDCLIFATGFEVSTDYSKRSGFEVHGRGGLTLTQKWGGGLSTLHGMHVRGFPNCFVMSQAQSGMSPNFPHMLNEQAEHAAHIIGHCLKGKVRTVEATETAERDWVETILRGGKGRRAFLESCTPGYYNNEGKMSDTTALSFPYGPGPIAFIDLLRQWREAGDFAGLELDGQVRG